MSRGIVRPALAAIAWTLAAVGASGQPVAPHPLRVEDALTAGEITQRVPIRFSPDGSRLAYTVQYPKRIEPTGAERYEAIPKTGAGPEALGCDVWVVSTRTGESKNLTEGRGTSWGPAWSPDGRALAFFSDRDGFSRVWVWETETGNVRRISDAIVRTEFNFEVARWTPDGRQILAKILPANRTLEQIRDSSFAAEGAAASLPASGAATVEVFRAGPDLGSVAQSSTEETPIDEGPPARLNINRADLAALDVATGRVTRIAEKVRPRGYWFSPGGSEIAFTDIRGYARNTQQPLYDLKVVRLATGEMRTVLRGLPMAYGISVSWSPDGKSLAYLRSGQTTEDQCVVVDAADGHVRFAAPAARMETDWQENPPFWDPDGKAMLVMGLHAVSRIDAASGESRPLFQLDDGEILNLLGKGDTGGYWSPRGDGSFLVAVRDGKTKRCAIWKVDVRTGGSRALFSGEISLRRGPFGFDVSSDGSAVAFASEDATHPEDLWIASTDFGARRRLTRVNPAMEGLAYGATRLVEWNAGTERIRGALLLPAGYVEGKRYPLIVNVYGGSSRSNSLFRFGLSGAGVENMQLFATRGFAMLLPDAPIDLSKHAPMSEIARTVLPGVDRVIELGIADPKRLGVMGHSYGGYSTLSLIVQTPRFGAAMASASFSSLLSMYGEMRGGESGSIGYLEKGQGDMGDSPWAVRDRYVANSPFFFLDRVQTPLLLIHGSLDVPARAEETFVALRRLGKEVEFARYAGEQHWEGTWGFANQVDYWNRALDWFEKHIGRESVR